MVIIHIGLLPERDIKEHWMTTYKKEVNYVTVRENISKDHVTTGRVIPTGFWVGRVLGG